MTTINDLVVSNSFSPDDKFPMWSNTNGVTRGLPISILTSNFLTQDDIALLAASASIETFTAGVDFTPGATLTLNLAHQYASTSNLEVHFDTGFQGPDQFSLVNQTLTFISPIPVGVNKVYVSGGAVRVIGAPSDGTVGTLALADSAVTTPKLAALAVTLAKLAAQSVDDTKLVVGSKTYNRAFNIVSVTDFAGCDPTGLTDSTAAFAAAKLAIEATGKAGKVTVPAGRYLISSVISNDRSGNAALPVVSWQGAGSDVTTITYTGNGTLFNISGNAASASFYGKFSGMTLMGTGLANTFAFTPTLCSFFRFSDLHIEGFDYAFYGQDIDHTLYDMVTLRFNKKGFFARQNPTPVANSTEPNQLTFLQCQFGSNSSYAVDIEGGAANTFVGCQFEVNGAGGPSGFGVTINGSSLQGGPAVIFDGCYFESNNGVADLILQSITPNLTPPISDATYVLNGCSFNRASGTYKATNSILTNFADPSIVGQQKLILNGCTFKGFNSYVPNAGTPYINYSGISTRTKNNFFTTGCVFQSALEAPTAVQNPAKCYVEIGKAANQSVPNATPTVWAIDSVSIGFSWSTAPSANAITIPEAGCYSIKASLTFTGAVTGVTSALILKNGVALAAGEITNSSIVSVDAMKTFNAGDVISVSVNQNSGGAVTIANSGIANSYLTLTKMIDG